VGRSLADAVEVAIEVATVTSAAQITRVRIELPS
jgi:hypothetical protein